MASRDDHGRRAIPEDLSLRVTSALRNWRRESPPNESPPGAIKSRPCAEFGLKSCVVGVRPSIDVHFLIEFGCLAGPLAGDGGEWEVRFDEEGGVDSVVPGVVWIS